MTVVEPRKNELDDNLKDHLVAVARGVTSLVPIVGGFMGELVTATIPNQRADRIAAYLSRLAERVDRLNAELQAKIFHDPIRIDLIEEGGFQAARALSQERIAQIVEAVVRGLESDDADALRRKRLLALFGELDDDEVILLNAYGQSYGGRAPDVWDAVNRPDPPHIDASRHALDRNELYEAGKHHLMRLGLLQKRFPFLRAGQMPEFDRNAGDFKHNVEVSPLGRLVLREIGLPSSVDEDEEDPDEV